MNWVSMSGRSTDACGPHLENLGYGWRLETRGQGLGSSAEIVETVYVVRMGVCIPNRVDVSDTRGKQLKSQFGWRIDQNRAPVQLEQRPVARSLVAGVL